MAADSRSQITLRQLVPTIVADLRAEHAAVWSATDGAPERRRFRHRLIPALSGWALSCLIVVKVPFGLAARLYHAVNCEPPKPLIPLIASNVSRSALRGKTVIRYRINTNSIEYLLDVEHVLRISVVATSNGPFELEHRPFSQRKRAARLNPEQPFDECALPPCAAQPHVRCGPRLMYSINSRCQVNFPRPSMQGAERCRSGISHQAIFV